LFFHTLFRYDLKANGNNVVMELLDLAIIFQLFVLINPLSSLPMLVSAHKQKMNVKRIAVSATVVAFIVAFVMTAIGPNLFSLFSISIDTFKIAGGLVLVLLSIETFLSKGEPAKNINATDSIISIIATPLLTGPAVISFVIIKSLEIGTFAMEINLIPAFILTGIIFVFLSFALNKLNMQIVAILSKILALFLTAIGIELIISGARVALGAGI
jgi:multiple antibiotic resistance protein